MIRRFFEAELDLPPEASIVLRDGKPYLRISEHLVLSTTLTKIDAAFMAVQRDLERALKLEDASRV